MSSHLKRDNISTHLCVMGEIVYITYVMVLFLK
jgi:hypothetical protein